MSSDANVARVDVAIESWPVARVGMAPAEEAESVARVDMALLKFVSVARVGIALEGSTVARVGMALGEDGVKFERV